jgi:hypothetical protein
MEYRLVDTGDLKAISKALKQHADGNEIRKELQRELGQITGPMVARVRQAWLSAPSRQGPGRGQPDLRKLLAAATRAERRLTGRNAGVVVRTDGRKMPSGMRALPGYAEGIRRRPWRHPVYGDRETWVPQQPFPRFYDAVQPDEAAAQRAVQLAVYRVLDKIVRA